MKTRKKRTVSAGKPTRRGVFIRLLIFLLTAGLLAVIFTAGAKFLAPASAGADGAGSGNTVAALLRFTFPLAFLCSFPFATLKKYSGGEFLSAILIMITSFAILYAILPGLLTRAPSRAGRLIVSPGSVRANGNPNVFTPVRDGYLFSAQGKTVHIITGESSIGGSNKGLNIKAEETDPTAEFQSPDLSRNFPLAPVIGDIGFLNERLSRDYEIGRGPFALYVFALLLFCTGAFLLSSISAWPAFNFFVCVLFTKLLFFMHRFFSSGVFADLEIFFARFTKLNAANIFLLGGGLLFILLSLIHYSRWKGRPK